MGTYYAIIWLMALGTAAAFAAVAYRAKTNPLPWAVGGWLLGLLITTSVFGLTEAAFIPLSSHEAGVFRFRAILISLVLIFLLGSALTINLYRRK